MIAEQNHAISRQVIHTIDDESPSELQPFIVPVVFDSQPLTESRAETAVDCDA
jgi:hypothetical protein